MIHTISVATNKVEIVVIALFKTTRLNGIGTIPPQRPMHNNDKQVVIDLFKKHETEYHRIFSSLMSHA